MSELDSSQLVRPYTDNDYPDLVRWYMGWDMAVPPREMLPYNGFFIHGICAGFLYLTDSKLGIIDLYICNPLVSPHLRDKFLNMLTIEIIKCAKQNGYKALMATSNIESVKKRSEFHGFKFVGDTSVYMKEI